MSRSLARPTTTPIFPDEVAPAGGDDPDAYRDGPIRDERDDRDDRGDRNDRAAHNHRGARDAPAPRPFPRGSRPAIAAPTERMRVARPAGRSGGEILARLLYFTSGALIAATVAVYGGRMWREARERPATAAVASAPPRRWP